MEYRGPKVVYGIPDKIQPVSGVVEGKQKFVFSNRDAGYLYVNNNGTIYKYALCLSDDNAWQGAWQGVCQQVYMSFWQKLKFLLSK